MTAGQPQNIERDEETTNMYNFMKKAKSPLKIKKLIIEYRVKIHELENMDEETKIRMIFALSAPIDSGFLVKIKESDDVQTDHARRTTEYTTKEGGFELKGTYTSVSLSTLEQRYRTIKDICIRLPATTPVPQTPKNQRTGQTPIKTTKE
ncbi:hypothetical protein GCK72_016528 [Caenorhabditis remanei]|uniref:SPK domain-containing protein n=1 Tax=Caenorhabditis remanei TaxID=31234 RepID=A0A6A5G597_CAERE|nr:hypothetical protein GCK72_016528 [Caenorhabditis remanei]KAF1749983.1 hypothetical protein GCK72_016528 [Caenorhabditis remanei]